MRYLALLMLVAALLAVGPAVALAKGGGGGHGSHGARPGGSKGAGGNGASHLPPNLRAHVPATPSGALEKRIRDPRS